MQKRRILKKIKFMLPIKSSIEYNLNQSESSLPSENNLTTLLVLTEGYSLEDHLNPKPSLPQSGEISGEITQWNNKISVAFFL